MQPFHELLRAERETRSIGVHRAAKGAGVCEDVYRGWEAGRGTPSKVELRRIFGERNQLEHLLPRLQTEAAPAEQPAEALAVAPPKAQPAGPATFGEALRLERKGDGLSAEDLGALLDVSASSVTHWEADDFAPIQEHLVKLTELFPRLAQAPKPASREMSKPGPDRGTPPPPRAPKALPTMHPATQLDPLAAIDRVILAFDALGQPVGLAPFERGADGWALRLVIPGELPPLAEGAGASLSAAALACLATLRAGLAARQEQTGRVVKAAQARLEAQTRALAAIDNALVGEAAITT